LMGIYCRKYGYPKFGRAARLLAPKDVGIQSFLTADSLHLLKNREFSNRC
jgi:hypothetical protein